jgi:hypothetical protein
VFADAFAKLRQATGTAVREQQEVFRKWVQLCPVAPLFLIPLGGPHPVRKEWGEIVGELARAQGKALEAQFGAGLRAIDEVLRIMKVKDCQDLGTRTIELWQKTWDCLRQTWDAQVRDYQAALTKGAKLLLNTAAPHVAVPGPGRGAA